MRTIKFRAWDIKRKIMIGSDYPNNWGNDKDEYWGDTALIDLTGIESISKNEDYKVMQFTGLLDKNGKEIYSGDIIKNGSGSIYKVESCIGGFECIEKDGGTYIFSVLNDMCEIIGNVWENPELLQGGAR